MIVYGINQKLAKTPISLFRRLPMTQWCTMGLGRDATGTQRGLGHRVRYT